MMRLNKKGQGAPEQTTGWLLALIVLIVVALVVWGVFSYLKSGTQLAPDQLTAASTYCEQAIYSDNPSVYCGSDYKSFTLRGKDAYYTCYDIAQQVSPAPEWSKTAPDCSNYKLNASAAKCFQLNRTGDLLESNPIYISDMTCEYFKATSSSPASLKLDGKEITFDVTSNKVLLDGKSIA